MRIESLEKYDIIIVGEGADDSWLAEDVKALVDSGKAKYIDRSEDEEGVREMFNGEIPEGTVVVVGIPGEHKASVCVLSAVGDSVVIHCEDKIIPLKEAKLS